MSSKRKVTQRVRAWSTARMRFGLSYAHVQMARELELDPVKLERIAREAREPWTAPVPTFIQALYRERFGKDWPEVIVPIDEWMIIYRETKQQARRRNRRRGQPERKPATPAELQAGATRPFVPIAVTDDVEGAVDERSPRPPDGTSLQESHPEWFEAPPVEPEFVRFVIQVPREWLPVFKFGAKSGGKEIRTAAAIHWYLQERIDFRAAADFAGMTVDAFEHELMRRHPEFASGVNEFPEDTDVDEESDDRDGDDDVPF